MFLLFSGVQLTFIMSITKNLNNEWYIINNIAQNGIPAHLQVSFINYNILLKL